MAPRTLLALSALLFVNVSVADQSQIPFSRDFPTSNPHRVAIIGGGAGGSSAAYHLRKYVNASPYDIPIEIDLFHSGPRIGGRTTTVNALDDDRFPVELGASIFLPINYILYNATKEFGLNTKTKLYEGHPTSNHDLGVWDGSQFVFLQGSGESWWQGYWDIAKLLWKYGTSPIKVQRLTKEIVGRFLQFYEQPLFPFRTIQEAVVNTDLLEYTSAPADYILAQAGIGEAFSQDIIQASTRVNYAQNLDQIHGLESMVCMAIEGAMAVEGGNWQIFNEATKRSKATVHLNTTVHGVNKDRISEKYYLTFNKEHEAANEVSELYDSIILAAPYQFSGIKFDPKLEYLPMSIDYVSLHVTLFTSPHLLSPTFFGIASDKFEDVPSTVLTTLPRGMGSQSEPHSFFSISTLRTLSIDTATPGLHKTQYIYKIFSSEPLTGTFISQLYGFEDSYTNTSTADPISDIPKEHLSWSHEKTWHSYPYQEPRTLFEKIRLDAPGLGQGIWYTSGIEPFISTMETSALMGMNVARLIVDELESLKQ